MHPLARDDSGTDAGPRAWLSRPDALLISRAGEKAAEVSGTPHLDNQLQKGSEYQCFDIRLTAIYRKLDDAIRHEKGAAVCATQWLDFAATRWPDGDGRGGASSLQAQRRVD